MQSEDAPPVIRRIHKRGTEAGPLRGRVETTIGGRPAVVEYEPDTELCGTEQIPLLEEGARRSSNARRVTVCCRHLVRAGQREGGLRNQLQPVHFYKPAAMRTLAAIRADIIALENETEGLLNEILAMSGPER